MIGVYREDLNWLVNDFTTRVEDVAHAIVVSADGLPLALSAGIPGYAVEQFAAITSGLTSLVVGAAQIMEAGVPRQAMVEMEYGLMFVMAISDGSSLSVLAAPECDTRQVSFEMTRLVEAVGELLTPAVRAQPQYPAAVSGGLEWLTPLRSVNRLTPGICLTLRTGITAARDQKTPNSQHARCGRPKIPRRGSARQPAPPASDRDPLLSAVSSDRAPRGPGTGRRGFRR